MNAGNLQFSARTAVFVGGIFVSVLLWLFFLNSADISLAEMVSFANAADTLAKVTSLNFILFVLLFPLTYTIVAVMAKHESRLVTMLGAVLGFLVAAAAGFAVFPNVGSFGLLALFYVISMLAVAENATVKYKELKSYVNARVALNSTSTGTMVMGFGVLISVALIVMANQHFYVNTFEEGILDIARDAVVGQNTSALTETAADTLLETQRQLADTLMQNPVYEKLKTKTDPDVILFVTLVDATRAQLDSTAVRDEMIRNLDAQKEQALSGVEIRGMLDTLPGYSEIKENYWIVAALVVFSLFLLLRIPFTILAVIYGTLLGVAGDAIAGGKGTGGVKPAPAPPSQPPMKEAKPKPVNAVRQKLKEFKP